ncbi:hypothetical protein T484DRAFT_2866567 [Baffinella frigidus]|nr:hypothetical protein T484DRAFT_2866567 [Cryptophyta sp. CCMP2293]|mmetsp:Transcript_11560/g.28023  ORF Transcript_11560/g.28023 Transcript_11560/m.28023 type:complete len:312 (-) Transcript_11560:142-1077(-)
MWPIIKFIVGKPGVSLLFGGALLFLCLMFGFLIVGNVLTKCNSEVMPCTLAQQGSCLCSVRAADGTCWVRMEQTKRCFKSTMQIKSGVCEGAYETGLCAAIEEEVIQTLDNLATAITELHPSAFGTCNVSFSRENDRCRLPVPVQEEREFYHPECCRAPVTTCENDFDCCNCGQSAPVCAPPLSCQVTGMHNGSILAVSTPCESTMDACASFIYEGCGESTCQSEKAIQPYGKDRALDAACCDIPGNCTCRAPCQPLSEFPGCPCLATRQGCVRKQCVQSESYFAEGGVEQVLLDLGAHAVKLCYTDNCND